MSDEVHKSFADADSMESFLIRLSRGDYDRTEAMQIAELILEGSTVDKAEDTVRGLF